MKNIIPVLLGADLNCYNVARAFHEAYGTVAFAFGRYEIGCTKHSRIVKFTEVPDFDDPDTFVKTLLDFASTHTERKLILIGCTDDYAGLIIKSKEKLKDHYIMPYIDEELWQKLQSKANFYKVCDTYGIKYPSTKIIDKDYDESILDSLGFDYPIIVKPSSSILYWKYPFDGMKKVYFASSPEEAKRIIDTIYASGYPDEIILQDTIPGEDSNMRVLTAYSDKDGKVRMMCLGHVLLEEHSPKARGNHAAILTEENRDLCEFYKNYLESIGYIGFSNFDIKYDERDGTYRAFEINLRQGRSNYYVTASDCNIARLIVEDRLGDGLEGIRFGKPAFWHIIPKKIIYSYLTKLPEIKKTLHALVADKKEFSSYFYKFDLRYNPRRIFYALAYTFNHYNKYRKYPK
ncbi:MAG: ATP-grasp domain-containing protein [Clostridia bacterium]|nr:ATP-grasp domain-containing protein [Clostridia bacterium]